MKPGIYEDIPYEEYAEIPAFRSHDLTAVIKCPYSWKHQKEIVQTPALLEGRVQHTVFLEHHKFDEEFVIMPKLIAEPKLAKLSMKILWPLLVTRLRSPRTCTTFVWNVEKSLPTIFLKKITGPS